MPWSHLSAPPPVASVPPRPAPVAPAPTGRDARPPRRAPRAPIALALLLAWASPAFARPPAPPAPPSSVAPAAPVPCDRIPGLSGRWADIRSLQADYADVRTIRFLEAPLSSTGRMVYLRPDRLRMDTRTPSRQSVVVDGGRVTVRHDDLGRTERMDLDADRTARAVVDSILRVFGGRFDALDADYVCAAAPQADGWRLALTPRNEPVSRAIVRIDVDLGPDRLIRRVVLNEVGGDTSTLTFSDVRVNAPMTPDEEAAHFPDVR